MSQRAPKEPQPSPLRSNRLKLVLDAGIRHAAATTGVRMVPNGTFLISNPGPLDDDEKTGFAKILVNAIDPKRNPGVANWIDGTVRPGTTSHWILVSAGGMTKLYNGQTKKEFLRDILKINEWKRVGALGEVLGQGFTYALFRCDFKKDAKDYERLLALLKNGKLTYAYMWIKSTMDMEKIIKVRDVTMSSVNKIWEIRAQRELELQEQKAEEALQSYHKKLAEVKELEDQLDEIKKQQDALDRAFPPDGA